MPFSNLQMTSLLFMHSLTLNVQEKIDINFSFYITWTMVTNVLAITFYIHTHIIVSVKYIVEYIIESGRERRERRSI
jgi:hypothetical protein